MYPIITLLIVSSIGISLFALITYKMRESSNLRLRKSIILIGMVTSIVTPILGLLLPEICEMLSPNVGRLSKETLSFALEPIVITPTGNVESSMLRLPSLVEVITAVWGIGLVLASLSLLAHLISLRSVLHGAKLVERYNGIEVYRLREGGVAEPFSVFGKIYLPFEEPAGQAREHILRHEAAHIQDGHGSERFLMLFFTRLYWFLPQAYYMQEELKDTHEYIADRLTIQEQGFDIKAYQYHLLNTLISGSNLNIVHAFNSDKQQLKKRIIMMNKQKTTRAYRWVWLLALPIVATMLWATNALTAQETNDKAEGQQEEQAMAISRQTKDAHTDKAQKSRRKKEKATAQALHLEGIEVNAYVMPEVEEALREAEKAIREVEKIDMREVGKALQEAEKAVREVEKIDMREVVEKALQEAEKAVREGTEAIRQAEKELSNSEAEQPQKKSKKKADKQKDKGKQVEVDWPNTDAPKFIGDTPGLKEYLSKNIKYPEEAVKKKEQGRVIVQFDVDPQGQHSNYRVVRSVSPSLDAEAIRVIKAIPNYWIAAYDLKQKKHVSASFTLPVVFRLP